MPVHPNASYVHDLVTYDPATSLGFLISQVRCELLSALEVELSAEGRLAAFELTAAQFVVIAALATAKSDASMSITALCKRVTYDAGAMTRMLDRLESKQLIRRHRCTADRRVVYVELTEQSRAAFPHMWEVSIGVLNRFLSGFKRFEARQLENYLGRMLQNARRAT